MATRKKEKQRKGSFFLNAINAFTAFIYSLFANGRTGSWLSRADRMYENSFCARLLNNTAQSKKNGALKKQANRIFKESKILQLLRSLREIMSSLKVQVYGMFFLVYGITSAIMYFVPILLYREGRFGISSLFTSVTVIVCSLPMLMSSKNLATTIYENKFLNKVFLSFLGVPEEKLASNKKKTGGVESMFVVGIIAIACGIMTYFLHSSYLLWAVLAIIVMVLVFSTTETGVVITIAATPFLGYLGVSNLILISLVAITAISYAIKVIKHRRVVTFSAESILVFIFCGFMIVASLFSDGGAQTVWDTLYSVVIILGGFFMTYNLIRERKRLNACVKIMTVSFFILAAVGVWNVFYDAIADGFIYSIHEYARPIFEGQSLNIPDTAEVYGVLAVIVTPMLFAYMSKERSVRGVTVRLIAMAIVVLSVFIYGTYETAIAMLIEFCLFWLLYSHKTLTALIVLMIPVGAFVIIYPYLAQYVDFGEALKTVSWILPEESSSAPMRMSVFESTLAMLRDGRLLGIGAGEHAFTSSYYGYATAVSEGATSSGSHWLQVMCWSGIGGTAVFLIFCCRLLCKGVGSVAGIRENENRRKPLALTVALFMALVFGSVSCLWDDVRMLYLFWTAAGLLAGYVRAGREEEQKSVMSFSHGEADYDVELRFYK